MANSSISIRLALSCCNCNYLKHVCNQKPKVLYGRTFRFVWSYISDSADLYCNEVCVGTIKKGQLSIFPLFVSVVQSESRLRSIMSSFNLFPC